jgi:hypothetical protein
MAVIDLQMAVEVDTEQLDKLQEKMKQTDELFLKKIEKATTILPKGVEKVNHAWLQMMSKVGVYVDKFIDNIRSGIEIICSKMDEMKEILSGIRQDLGGLEEALNRSTLIQFFTTVGATIFSVSATLLTAKGSIAVLGAVFAELGSFAGAALASIGSALGPLLLLLGEGALIVGTFLAAFKFTDWILEITGARKYIDDFMFWIVDNFLSIKDEIVDAINYLVDYPEERLNVLKQFMVNVLDSIVGGIKTAFDKVWKFLTSKPQWSVDLVESIKSFFVDTWESISKSFTEGLSSAWGAVETFFNKNIAWIKSVFDISDFIKGIGKQIIDKFKQGLSDGWEGAKDFFTKNVVNWLRGKLQLSNSPPFTIPYECGLGIMAAYSKGMKENLPLLESTLNEINTKVETGLQNPEVDMNQWFLDNIPYERDYSNLALLPPVASNKTGIDQSQTKKGGGEGAAKDSGFFGGLWSSFKSAVDDLKKQFGFGGGKGLLGNLFGGIGRDIKGLIKYVCYRNYTNFLYKQNVVFFWDAVKQSLTLFCKCQAGVNILFVEKFKKAAKPTTRFAYI